MTYQVFRGFSLALLSCAGALSVSAQTSVDATCSIAPPSISKISIEHLVDLTKILSTLTPTLPASVLGPIFSGQQEVHSRILYDNSTKILTNDLFEVPVGSPIPTPSSYNITQNRFAYVIANIDKIYLTCLPRPSVWMSGLTADGYPIYGNPTGSVYAVGFGYTMDSPAKIRDLVGVSPGIAATYDGNVFGSIVFGKVGAVITGGPVIVTNSPFVTLDGTASTGGPLTYSWSTPVYGVALLAPGSAITPLWLDGGFGDYVVNLMVRNGATGDTATTTVTIRYKAAS